MVLRSPELMNPAETLLVVIDLQERLLPVIPTQRQVVWNVERLVDGVQTLGMSVVATEQYPEKLGRTVSPIHEKLNRPAIAKLAFSCAGCTDLFGDLIEQGIHRLLLCGIETHVCVLQSAYDLLAQGFSVTLASDAVGSRYDNDHHWALRRLESAGVVVTTTEAALFELCTRAGTSQFKQISQLAKQSPPE